MKDEFYKERSVKYMLETPITDLSRLIALKWYLTLNKLAERAGVWVETIKRAVRGEEIGSVCERKLREFLENYKGEEI